MEIWYGCYIFRNERMVWFVYRQHDLYFDQVGAKKLALVHFDAQRYPTIEARKVAEVHAKKIFPNTVATRDEMNLNL